MACYLIHFLMKLRLLVPDVTSGRNSLISSEDFSKVTGRKLALLTQRSSAGTCSVVHESSSAHPLRLDKRMGAHAGHITIDQRTVGLVVSVRMNAPEFGVLPVGEGLKERQEHHIEQGGLGCTEQAVSIGLLNQLVPGLDERNCVPVRLGVSPSCAVELVEWRQHSVVLLDLHSHLGSLNWVLRNQRDALIRMQLACKLGNDG